MLHISLKLYAHCTSVRSGNTKGKILSGVGNIKADAKALPLYFIFDDREGKWEVQSMWQMKKVWIAPCSYSQYAAFITILLTILVLTVSSVLVLQFESNDPASGIKTGGDALWYSIVTITTVGYGNFYPVTAAGRVAGMFIMFAGVGIIGALASLLSSLLLGGGSPAPAAEEASAPAAVGPSDPEVAALKQELAEMHQLLEKIASGMTVKP